MNDSESIPNPHPSRARARWVRLWYTVALSVLSVLAGFLVGWGEPVLPLMLARALVIGLTALGMFVAPWAALASLVREKEAFAREQALEFELIRSELERRATDARLKLLQSQVSPHFLFNTLANVQALVDCDPAANGLRCPPMTLLTLVENAVRHGLDPSEEGGSVRVADTGVGLAAGGDSRGTWLATLRERLQLTFGGDATVTLRAGEPRGTLAELDFPAEEATRALAGVGMLLCLSHFVGITLPVFAGYRMPFPMFFGAPLSLAILALAGWAMVRGLGEGSAAAHCGDARGGQEFPDWLRAIVMELIHP